MFLMIGYFTTLFVLFMIFVFYILPSKDRNYKKSLKIDEYFLSQKDFKDQTINEKIIINDYVKKEDFTIEAGLYKCQSVKSFGSIEMIYLISDDNTITKEIKTTFKDLNKINYLRGSADFKVDGSVLKFSNVIGSKGMFSLLGEAMSVSNDGSLVLPHFDEDKDDVILFTLSKV